VLGALKDEAVIAQNLRRGNLLQFIELGMIVDRKAPVVVEHDGLPTPLRVPIPFCVEVEDVRSQLALRVNVGHQGKTAWRKMPVHCQFNMLT
jgi:hypothetical protein